MPLQKRCEPFELRLTLRAPVMLSHPWVHLDGLLAHLMRLHLEGWDYYALPTKQVHHAHLPPPWRGLLKQTNGINHASVSAFGPEVRWFSARYYKRTELDALAKARDKRKVHLGSGFFRLWQLEGGCVAAQECRFYGCGRLDLLEQLLPYLTHLGDNTRVGWGAIARVELIPLNEDRSIVYAGRAMRPIPVRLLKRWSDSAILVWHPPYWDNTMAEECAVPGAEVEFA